VRVRVHRRRLLHRAPQLRVPGLHGCSIDLLGRRPGAAPCLTVPTCEDVKWNGTRVATGEVARQGEFFMQEADAAQRTPRAAQRLCSTTTSQPCSLLLLWLVTSAVDVAMKQEPGPGCLVGSACLSVWCLVSWGVGGQWTYPLIKHWHRATYFFKIYSPFCPGSHVSRLLLQLDTCESK
jgi:hypothetical protein